MHGHDREHSAATVESREKTWGALTSDHKHIESLNRDTTIQRDAKTPRSWEGFVIGEPLLEPFQAIDPWLGRFLDDHHIRVFLYYKADKRCKVLICTCHIREE